MFTYKIVNADYEVTAVYRNKMFRQIYGPGVHRVSRLGGRLSLITIDLRQMPIRAPASTALTDLAQTNRAAVAEFFHLVDMQDGQLGLVFADGKLIDLVGQGQQAFYAKGLCKIEVLVIDPNVEVLAPANLVEPLSRVAQPGLVKIAEVANGYIGLLYVDGKLEQQLEPGCHAIYQASRRIDLVQQDLRLQILEVTGQEVLTKDQIGVRANVTAVYRVVDPNKVAELTADLKDYLYKELQFSLRQVVGTRTLDEVLGDKQGINAAIGERLLPNLADAGVEVPTVGVKDVILPGDIREMVNRVIEAEKFAKANVIKRREETAATRSLLNTAKLMDDNPTLLRLKELEALEKVSEKIGNVVVGNGMDGVIEDLVRIRPRRAGKP
ncbi:MAG: slipin family protein [Alphaproteobacteria bacterium]|jgi:hypothetical protein|nr:slipin family protein [Alphaproteobacteria bacterium]